MKDDCPVLFCHKAEICDSVKNRKCPYLQVIDKLAAYEDTGLEPEEVTELMAAHGTAILELSEYRSIGTAKHLLGLTQAEKDGRMVVQNLPTPGDTIWVIERDKCEEPLEISGYMFLAFSGQAVIATPFVVDCETLDETVKYLIEETSKNYGTDLRMFPETDCYLTYQEAEAALKKEEEADNDS